MAQQSDALVIGAGPAGASAAILLAAAGWRVTLVEQSVYPRQKVCGECIAAGNFPLLDELGVGNAVRRLAGAALEHVGWMRADTTVTAEMPPCPENADRYGRALGRDVFDDLLLERARAMRVRILQPARVRKVWGRPGQFHCAIEHCDRQRGPDSRTRFTTVSSSMLIDAHGSWESGPQFQVPGTVEPRARRLRSDLFAFKATFSESELMRGLLPVLAFTGGYGGLVLANDGRTTVAFCVRRDTLNTIRAANRGVAAGVAVESYLRESCHGVRTALKNAQREGSWLTVGPLRPGVRLIEVPGIFRVGNAAGETHPLIGEGISMALQSSKLLATCLFNHADRDCDSHALSVAQRAYERAWRQAFLPRLRRAALYAHVAMRASLAAPVGGCLRQWPSLLTTAARFAGKARPGVDTPTFSEERI